MIADAAKVEFSAFGYAGARVERIARRARVNKQLIFYYFGSKAGLYEAVAAGAVRSIGGGDGPEEAMDAVSAAPAPEQLRRIVRHSMASMAARPELVSLLFDTRRGEQVGGVARDAARGMVARVRSVVSRGQGLGYFRDDVDPEIAARQAVVLLAGYLGLEPLLAEAPVEQSRARWADAATDLLVKGLSW